MDGVYKASRIGIESLIVSSETMNMLILFSCPETLSGFAFDEWLILFFLTATGIFRAVLQITCLNKLIQPSSITTLLFLSVFIKNTYGKKTKYKIILWINVPCPRNLAIKVWVTDMTKLPIISTIEVAAVICALIIIVLMLSLLVDLDAFAGAICLDAGSSLLKIRNTQLLICHYGIWSKNITLKKTSVISNYLLAKANSLQ